MSEPEVECCSRPHGSCLPLERSFAAVVLDSAASRVVLLEQAEQRGGHALETPLQAGQLARAKPHEERRRLEEVE